MKNNLGEYIQEKNGRRILDMKYSEKGNGAKDCDQEAVTGQGKVTHHDGYKNLLTKYGTSQDSSTAYTYAAEDVIPDMDLTDQYFGNGLFAKIIDSPSEEAVKHGYDFKLNDPKVEDFISDELDRLDWEETAATAIKWARLYGGAVVVMLVDDGCDLEEPLDWDNAEEIEELLVYERAVVQPDQTSLYTENPGLAVHYGSRFQRPEFYTINSRYGSFRVHESRCLIFQNGKLPETGVYSTYLYFGIPEYLRIKDALRDAVVSHAMAPKILDRCVQAIYKLKDLSKLLMTADGEEKVLDRLELIDLARGLLNTLVIDAEGEDYDFKSMPLAGVKDVIDTTCNMLSAVTNIPQTMEYGPVIIADGLIKEMVTLDTGIREITNDIAPVPGRFEADDVEARQNFIKRCATRSKNMIESVTAEIYNSVDNVLSVAGYENDTEAVDSEGRPPKSVEFIVDGGDEGEIANIIYRKKTNGIRSYGSILMDVADEFGNLHKVGFNRPDYRYIWLRVAVTKEKGKPIAPNYIQLTQDSILEDAEVLQVGDSVYLQKFLTNIYKNLTAVSMVDIRAYAADTEKYVPAEAEYSQSSGSVRICSDTVSPLVMSINCASLTPLLIYASIIDNFNSAIVSSLVSTFLSL